MYFLQHTSRQLFNGGREMAKLFNGILGKKQMDSTESVEAASAENNEDEIEHLFITEDDKKNKKFKKKAVQKDPKIDTAILRKQIADKIAKINNN